MGKLKTEINLFVPPSDIYKDMNIRVSKSDAGKVNVSKETNSTDPVLQIPPVWSLTVHVELQLYSDGSRCESIKIGSLKARPSNCRLPPCMTASPAGC